jgi:hypothetical protein
LIVNRRRTLRTGRWLLAATALCTMGITAVALGTVQKRASTSIPAGQIGSATAECDPGQVALAAGFGISPWDPNTSNGGPIARLGSQPAGKSAIKTTAFNFNNTAAGTLYSYAYCGKRAKPPKIVSSDTQVQPNSVATVQAKCPEGSRVISGGFATDNTVVTLTSKRSGNRGWKVEGFYIGQTKTKGSAEATLSAYAICKSPGPTLTTESKDTTVSNSLKTTNVRCSNGSKAVSGGFDGNLKASGQGLDAAGALFSKRFDHARGWTTEGISTGQPQATLTTYAYCRK